MMPARDIGLAVAFLALFASVTASYDIISPANCNVTNVIVGPDAYFKQGIISLNDMSQSYSTLNCLTTINIVTPLDYHLAVRFTKLRVSCSRKAYVSVRGNSSNVREYCGSYRNWPALYSSANFLNISYYHGLATPSTDETVQFYYTAYHEGDCNTDHDDDDDDDDGEFQCGNNRCIDSSITCDGYDNCGDWSDESMWTCGFSTGIIIALSVTCSLAGITLIVCCVCICQKSKARKNRAESVSATQVVPDSSSNQTPMFSMPAPPPYVYSNTVCASDAGCMQGDVSWAAPHDGLPFDNSKPPEYEEISQPK